MLILRRLVFSKSLFNSEEDCILRYSVLENLEQIAMDLDKPISDITVLILDRPRHQTLIQQCREAGARYFEYDLSDVNACAVFV